MRAVRVVVGKCEIEIAVAVEVDPLHSMGGAERQPECGADVRKARAFMVKQEVVLLERLVDVRRHVQIRASVIVVVAPARRRRFVAAGKTELRSDLGESSSTVVAIEKVGPVTCNE